MEKDPLQEYQRYQVLLVICQRPNRQDQQLINHYENRDSYTLRLPIAVHQLHILLRKQAWSRDKSYRTLGLFQLL